MLAFIKWNFVFTLRTSGPDKTAPAKLVPTPLHRAVNYIDRRFQTIRIGQNLHANMEGFVETVTNFS